MQVEYQQSHPILIKKNEQPITITNRTYSLSEKLFDPASSPPASDFMKRLFERHVYYNMVKNSSKHPST
jgi:hypothetical protein